jgi:hypothetical protein
MHTEVLNSTQHHHVLASPLHRQSIERKIWGKLPERVFRSSHATPLAFSIEVIHQFSPNNLASKRKVGWRPSVDPAEPIRVHPCARSHLLALPSPVLHQSYSAPPHPPRCKRCPVTLACPSSIQTLLYLRVRRTARSGLTDIGNAPASSCAKGSSAWILAAMTPTFPSHCLRLVGGLLMR